MSFLNSPILNVSLDGKGNDGNEHDVGIKKTPVPDNVVTPKPLISLNNSSKCKLTSKPGRCSKCERKTGLMPFDCKCGYKFCTKCRLPYKHNCSFDHAAIKKNALEKANPRVVANKINRI